MGDFPCALSNEEVYNWHLKISKYMNEKLLKLYFDINNDKQISLGGMDNFSLFDCSSSFCYFLIEIH